MTEAELERLAILMEECAEVQQVIGKIIRFGWEDSHPKHDNQTNRKLLTQEMADLRVAMNLLLHEDDIDLKEFEEAEGKKLEKINKYLKHNHVTI